MPLTCDRRRTKGTALCYSIKIEFWPGATTKSAAVQHIVEKLLQMLMRGEAELC